MSTTIFQTWRWKTVKFSLEFVYSQATMFKFSTTYRNCALSTETVKKFLYILIFLNHDSRAGTQYF